MSDEEEVLSQAFRSLGHPDRRRVLRALIERELACCSSERADECVFDAASCELGDLARSLDCAPPTVSRLLRELQAAGLVERAHDERFVYARVNAPVIQRLRDFLASPA